MMDKLFERASIFNRLLDCKYNIILGKRTVLTNICITFNKIHFHHLIGLQYLSDRPELNQDRTRIFDQILNNELTYHQISSSGLFCDIESRFLSFLYIEDFLDSNGLVFRFNSRANTGSSMKAKYILENTIDSGTAYVCIDNTDNSNEYFCRSFFPKEKIDYTSGHTRHTLLYKEKIHIATQEKVIQYDKLTPKEELNLNESNV